MVITDENFLSWLSDNHFKLSQINTGKNNVYTIYFDNEELISFQASNDKFSVINVKEVLYNKYLKKDESCIENIKKYLNEYKSKIENENIYNNSSDDGDENLELYDSKSYSFLVRELQQPMGFSTLMESIDKKIFIIPKNQRNYVWSKEQVENLAVSLIRGFPIPPLYGYRNDENQIVILDGQQRLISLYLYYHNKFLKNTSKTPIDLRNILSESNSSNFSFLEELRKEFGLRDEQYFFKTLKKESTEEISLEITYNKLDEKSKRLIDFRPINIIEILVQGEGEGSKEDIFFKIFGNLNQGGTQLKNQELRNGIYQCSLYDMLHDINNNNTKWRVLYGPKHKHSRDVELLLRFVATDYMFNFQNGLFNLDEHSKENIDGPNLKIKKFDNSYPKLLNDFSKLALHFSEDTVSTFKIKIEKFIARIESEKNIPNLLLESLYLASNYVPGDYLIEESFINSIEEENEYIKCTGASSSSKSNVEKRLNFVYKKLSEKYGDNNE